MVLPVVRTWPSRAGQFSPRFSPQLLSDQHLHWLRSAHLKGHKTECIYKYVILAVILSRVKYNIKPLGQEVRFKKRLTTFKPLLCVVGSANDDGPDGPGSPSQTGRGNGRGGSSHVPHHVPRGACSPAIRIQTSFPCRPSFKGTGGSDLPPLN